VSEQPVPVDWQDAPSTATPITAENLKRHDAWLAWLAGTAQEFANLAQQYAEAAAAPGADAVAGYIADGGSAVREQLDARFATLVGLAELQEQTASTEDLCFTTHIQTGATTTWPNTSTQSVPLFSAPFRLAIQRVAMLMWSSTGNAGLSDSSYWLVELRKHSADNATTTLVAQKSTRLNAVTSPTTPAQPGSTGLVPAGTAIAARIPWVFSSAILAGVTLEAGESLSWNTFPVPTSGTNPAPPTAMYGPVALTIGYRPL
jgi:hypothetical protein